MDYAVSITSNVIAGSEEASALLGQLVFRPNRLSPGQLGCCGSVIGIGKSAVRDFFRALTDRPREVSRGEPICHARSRGRTIWSDAFR